jgi:hypothetical protein
MTWSLRRNTDEPNLDGAAAGELGLGVGYRLWPRRDFQGDTFSKKCALTSPANVAGLDAGGPHPSFLYSREADWSQTRRGAAPCRFLSLPSAYDPQDAPTLSPIDASPKSKDPYKRREFGALSDWSPSSAAIERGWSRVE